MTEIEIDSSQLTDYLGKEVTLSETSTGRVVRMKVLRIVDGVAILKIINRETYSQMSVAKEPEDIKIFVYE